LTAIFTNKNQLFLVVIASLGYFVDIYDIVLFNIVKETSLKDLGIWTKEVEVSLFNWQMTGMMIGGVFWGILGDKVGRIKVLFGSILLYSLANIFNAYAFDITSYKWLRFIAGFGLAGELGAGITLILETMDKKNRGWGTMIMVSFGALGACFAFYVGQFGWKTAFWVGGILGLILLLMRMKSLESDLFKNMNQNKNKGNIFLLFTTKKMFLKYMACIGMGLPIWFVVSILIGLSSSYFSEILNIKISVGKAVMYCYIGLALGDLISGFLSQIFYNRLKIIQLFLLFTFVLLLIYIYFIHSISSDLFYFICVILGIVSGYWALFVTVAAEQFGTNIRSTVASTVPNWVRGAVVPITLSFKYLAATTLGIMNATLIVGGICLLIAVLSSMYLKETFGKELDYIED